MSRPIKSHLPLITTRIEFKFNLLPPPPQLTTRRDFGAHVRRHMRRNPSPYDRPKARTKPPAITRSITVDFQSDSALSDISDAEEDEDSPSSSKLIPKPGGEAGKVNSGGYNLENALGWTKKRYEEFSDHIKAEVASKLDFKKCFTSQKAADIDQVIQSTAKKFDIENVYLNNWPIREALKSRLKYTADFEKKKEMRKAQTDLKEAIKPFKGKRQG